MVPADVPARPSGTGRGPRVRDATLGPGTALGSSSPTTSGHGQTPAHGGAGAQGASASPGDASPGDDQELILTTEPEGVLPLTPRHMEHYSVEVDNETTLLMDADTVQNPLGQEVNLSMDPANFGKDRVLRPRLRRDVGVARSPHAQVGFDAYTQHPALELSRELTRTSLGPVICLLETSICDNTFWDAGVVATATTRRYHMGVEVLVPKIF